MWNYRKQYTLHSPPLSPRLLQETATTASPAKTTWSKFSCRWFRDWFSPPLLDCGSGGFERHRLQQYPTERQRQPSSFYRPGGHLLHVRGENGTAGACSWGRGRSDVRRKGSKALWLRGDQSYENKVLRTTFWERGGFWSARNRLPHVSYLRYTRRAAFQPAKLMERVDLSSPAVRADGGRHGNSGTGVAMSTTNCWRSRLVIELDLLIYLV